MIIPKECIECSYYKTLSPEYCSEFCEICEVTKKNAINSKGEGE